MFFVLTFVMSAFATAAMGDEPGDATNTGDVPVPAALVDNLRAGGYVVYFRHMATNHDIVDTDTSDPTNCETQRRLSDLGRNQAEVIGKAFAALDIPVGRIVSSPLCRTRFSAELAFGRVQPDENLLFSMGIGADKALLLAERLRGQIAETPAFGENTLIFGHTANLREATGIWPKPEGVAVIFKPLMDGRFDYVASIHPDSWALAAGLPPASM